MPAWPDVGDQRAIDAPPFRYWRTRNAAIDGLTTHQERRNVPRCNEERRPTDLCVEAP